MYVLTSSKCPMSFATSGQPRACSYDQIWTVNPILKKILEPPLTPEKGPDLHLFSAPLINKHFFTPAQPPKATETWPWLTGAGRVLKGLHLLHLPHCTLEEAGVAHTAVQKQP